MIIAVLKISWERPFRKFETVMDQEPGSAKICREVMGLNREHYINRDAVPPRRQPHMTN